MPPLKLPYSHHVSTAEQSQKADRLTIEQFGIDGFTLMETAGLQAANFMAKKTSPSSAGLYVCGKGNNGGDALVVARYLAIHHDHECHILFPGGSEKLSADARKNLELLQKLKSENKSIHLYNSLEGLTNRKFDYVVDGLLGTGLSSNLRNPFDAAVELINAMEATVFAIDIPTGLHTDSGKTMPVAVRADYTLSFGTLKVGFYLHSGPDHTGVIHPFSLTFPEHYREVFAGLLSPALRDLLPSIRRKAEHKYSDRVLYLIAGSEGLTGAAIMAAASGWKAGAGAVILITPRGLLEIYEKNLPGIIKTPVGKAGDTYFREEHAGDVLELLGKKKGVLLIGPGIGRKESTVDFSKKIFSDFRGSAVIDADALQTIAGLTPPKNANWILTPHIGEAAKISGRSFEDDFDRITWVAGYAVNRSLTLVSKGNPTFVGTASGNNYITSYDCRIFARAGFGDVLAGRIAGNLAISDNNDLSIARALLDTYKKADEILRESDRSPEPNDLL